MTQSKPKGNNYENKIATQIRKQFVPAEFDDKTGHNLVHRTPMSGGHVEKGDIIMKPPILRAFPWFIECRNRESWSWKNVMEKGKKSVIGTWMQEDAIDKCHAYDYDAEYIRYPLLIFTKNFETDYFCARFDDLQYLVAAIIHTQHDAIDIFETTTWIKGYPEADWVMGKFADLMELFYDDPEDIAMDIETYMLGSNFNA